MTPTTDVETKVKRVSLSLSNESYDTLNSYIKKRGFQSRSQAISEIIHQSSLASHDQYDNAVLAGTITLVYDEVKTGLLEKIFRIQRENVDEVISSQHIMLEDNHTMEVLLVQGPASKLHSIRDRLSACKGVRTCNLTLTSILLLPIHHRAE